MARVVSQRQQERIDHEGGRATTLARPSIVHPSIHLARDLYQIRRRRHRRWLANSSQERVQTLS